MKGDCSHYYEDGTGAVEIFGGKSTEFRTGKINGIYITERIDRNLNPLTMEFSGVITVEDELPDTEFNKLLTHLSKTFNNSNCKIGIVDTKIRGIKVDIDYLVAPSIMAEIGTVLSFSQGIAVEGKANLLRAVPNYIVFREFISEQNIEDIICSMKHGHNVVAFTNLNKDDLFKLLEKVVKMPIEYRTLIFKTMNII